VFVTVELWRNHVVLVFIFLMFLCLDLHIWVEVIGWKFNLAVEMFSVFKQDSVVAGLRYYFSPVYWEYGSVPSICLYTQDTRTISQHCSDRGKLAGLSFRRFGFLFLGYFHYRSSPSCVLGATANCSKLYSLLTWAGSHLLFQAPSSLCPRAARVQPSSWLWKASENGQSKQQAVSSALTGG
jgi:hypothetical protein